MSPMCVLVLVSANDASQANPLRYLGACTLRGNKFIELPYVVKGMDVSFSGLLSQIEEKAG